MSSNGPTHGLRKAPIRDNPGVGPVPKCPPKSTPKPTLCAEAPVAGVTSRLAGEGDLSAVGCVSASFGSLAFVVGLVSPNSGVARGSRPANLRHDVGYHQQPDGPIAVTQSVLGRKLDLTHVDQRSIGALAGVPRRERSKVPWGSIGLWRSNWDSDPLPSKSDNGRPPEPDDNSPALQPLAPRVRLVTPSRRRRPGRAGP